MSDDWEFVDINENAAKQDPGAASSGSDSIVARPQRRVKPQAPVKSAPPKAQSAPPMTGDSDSARETRVRREPAKKPVAAGTPSRRASRPTASVGVGTAPVPTPEAAPGVSGKALVVVATVCLSLLACHCNGVSREHDSAPFEAVISSLQAENSRLLAENARLSAELDLGKESVERLTRKYSWLRVTSNVIDHTPRRIIRAHRANNLRQRNAKSVTLHHMNASSVAHGRAKGCRGSLSPTVPAGALPMPASVPVNSTGASVPPAAWATLVSAPKSGATATAGPPSHINTSPSIVSSKEPLDGGLLIMAAAENPSLESPSLESSRAGTPRRHRMLSEGAGVMEESCSGRLGQLLDANKELNKNVKESESAAGHWMMMFHHQSATAETLKVENDRMREEVTAMRGLLAGLQNEVQSVKTANERKYKSLVTKDPSCSQVSPWHLSPGGFKVSI